MVSPKKHITDSSYLSRGRVSAVDASYSPTSRNISSFCLTEQKQTQLAAVNAGWCCCGSLKVDSGKEEKKKADAASGAAN